MGSVLYPGLHHLSYGREGVLIAQRRARGSAAFAPTDIANLRFWFDASQIGTLWQDSARTTPVASDSDPVGAWDDGSGGALHATQATSGKRPLYKTGIQNGLAGVLLDGVDDLLNLPSATLGVGITEFHVVKLSTHEMIMEHGDVGAGYKGSYFYKNGACISLNHIDAGDYTQSTALNASAGSGWLGSAAALVTRRVNGTHASHDLRKDRAGVSLSSIFSVNQSSDLTAIGTLGGRGNNTLFSAGYLFETVVYNAALSDGDRDTVEAYLQAKWATP